MRNSLVRWRFPLPEFWYWCSSCSKNNQECWYITQRYFMTAGPLQRAHRVMLPTPNKWNNSSFLKKNYFLYKAGVMDCNTFSLQKDLRCFLKFKCFICTLREKIEDTNKKIRSRWHQIRQASLLKSQWSFMVAFCVCVKSQNDLTFIRHSVRYVMWGNGIWERYEDKGDGSYSLKQSNGERLGFILH